MTIENAIHDASRSLPFAQRREACSITSMPFSFGAIFGGISRALSSFFVRAGRRAIFITSVPVYWFLVFRHVLGYFDMSMFVFVVGLSYVISTLFIGHWGLLEWGMG